MLTVDYARWGIASGEFVLDLGCGGGRHALEAAKRGVRMIGIDRDETTLSRALAIERVMEQHGETSGNGRASFVAGDALTLPFADATFDRVIASEVLEHIHEDDACLQEIARVLKGDGLLAVTVPRWWPERICWALSGDYHEAAGAHVRIYKSAHLIAKVTGRGFELVDRHHAHALHSPYWWLKCAFGVDGNNAPARLYHRFLVWDIEKRPRSTRLLEALLNPVMGKSLVLYFRKTASAREVAHAA